MHLFSTCYKQRLCFLPATILPPFSTFFIYILKNTMNSHCKNDVNLDMIVTLWIFMITKYTAIFDRYFHSWKKWNVWENFELYFHRNFFRIMGNQNASFYCNEQFNTGILVISISSVARERERERWKICCEVFRIGVSLETEWRTKDFSYSKFNDRTILHL